MVTRNDIRPFKPVHPGSILREELRERGIKQKDFAQSIGMRPTHLSALLHGARRITPQLAIRLEKALDIPAQSWMNLQDNFILDTMRPALPVEGYEEKAQLNLAGVLSEPDSPATDQKGYDEGFTDGRNALLEEILDHLSRNGLSRSAALDLIGQK